MFKVWANLSYVCKSLITMIFPIVCISNLTPYSDEQRLAKVDEKACFHKVAEACWNEESTNGFWGLNDP